MPDKVGLVLIGAGLMGREHGGLISRHPDTVLAGVSDPSPAAADYAQQQGVPYFDDYRTMLDETRPDGAIISVPNALHEEAAIACMKRGIPSLVEKPIADTLQAAASIAAACEDTGIPVLIGHHRRHSPDIREARRVIREGLLGDLVAVNGMWLTDKPDDYFETEWRRKPGGGPFLINLTHDLDCLRFIVGEITDVAAFSANAARGFEVEDTASVALRFANGVLGTFLLSDAAASPFTWDLSSGQALYFPHQPEDCYHFAGRKGALAVPSMNLWRHQPPDGNWQDPFVRRHLTLDGSRAYENQLNHFIDVISGSAAPLVSAADAMMTLAATLAVDMAARENRTVNVEELI